MPFYIMFGEMSSSCHESIEDVKPALAAVRFFSIASQCGSGGCFPALPVTGVWVGWGGVSCPGSSEELNLGFELSQLVAEVIC